jgi:hypothetical protein
MAPEITRVFSQNGKLTSSVCHFAFPTCPRPTGRFKSRHARTYPPEDHLRRNTHRWRVRGLLIYCSDYGCSHSIAISADQWPDDLRLTDIEPRFVCQACGKRGADVRPKFPSTEMGIGN